MKETENKESLIFKIDNKTFWIGIVASFIITALFYTTIHLAAPKIDFNVIDIVNTFGTLVLVISLFFYSKIFTQNNEKHQETLDFEREKLRYAMNVRNEEDNMRKLKYAFEITENWHKPEMAKMVNKSKMFLIEWDEYIKENQNDPKVFNQKLNDNEESRTALMAILNYFEHISILMDAGFADEKTIKKAFSHLFQQYLLKTESYIKYRQETENSKKIFMYFLKYAKMWAEN
jgi:hypothetical protein